MLRSRILVHLLVIVVFLFGCSQVPIGAIDGASQGDIYGSWFLSDRYGDVEKMLVFHQDGRFELHGREGSDRYAWGMLRISGSRFRIWSTGGRFERDCRVKADYTFLVDGDTLILSVVSDPCLERQELFSRLWLRSP